MPSGEPQHLQQVVSRIADLFARHARGFTPEGDSPIARQADYAAARELLDRLSCDGYVVVDLAKIRSAGQGLAVAVAAAEAARLRREAADA